jgi:tetratricopeptide (TPR) repeat protein
MTNPLQSKLYTIVFGLLAVGMSVAFFWWTLLPYYQMSVWRSSLDSFTNGQEIAFPNDPTIFVRDTPAQGIMRLKAFSVLFNQYVDGKRTAVSPYYDASLNRFKDWVALHPTSYEYYLVLAKAYELKAAMTSDKKNYAISEDYFQKAISLSPKRQDTWFAYAEHVSNTQGALSAITILEKMHTEYPDLPQVEYYLGIILALNSKDNYDQSLGYLESIFEKNDTRIPLDVGILKNMYERFFTYYYERKDIPHFVIVIKRLLILDPDQGDAYTTILNKTQRNNQIPVVPILN